MPSLSSSSSKRPRSRSRCLFISWSCICVYTRCVRAKKLCSTTNNNKIIITSSSGKKWNKTIQIKKNPTTHTHQKRREKNTRKKWKPQIKIYRLQMTINKSVQTRKSLSLVWTHSLCVDWISRAIEFSFFVQIWIHLFSGRENETSKHN